MNRSIYHIYVPAFTFPSSSELLSELTVESWEYEKIWYSNKLSKLQLQYVCKYTIVHVSSNNSNKPRILFHLSGILNMCIYNVLQL